MGNTPSKLQMLQKLNEIITNYNTLKNNFVTLAGKLDSDMGVGDTDYVTMTDIDLFTADQLSALDQLINLRE